MTHDAYDAAYLRAIRDEVRTIAMVGASPKSNRPSHHVMEYLQGEGYRVIPVNPTMAGQEILGERTYATLTDLPEPVDMVDIFRKSEDVGPVVDEALALPLPQRPRVIWMQLGVRDDAAAARAEAAGLKVVMNRCPAIDFPRL